MLGAGLGENIVSIMIYLYLFIYLSIYRCYHKQTRNGHDGTTTTIVCIYICVWGPTHIYIYIGCNPGRVYCVPCRDYLSESHVRCISPKRFRRFFLCRQDASVTRLLPKQTHDRRPAAMLSLQCAKFPSPPPTSPSHSFSTAPLSRVAGCFLYSVSSWARKKDSQLGPLRL